jgi:hypothetical protein
MTAPAADRIEYGKLTAVVNARPDRGTQRALYAALNGINDADRTMRNKVAALRSALDDAEACLDAARLHTGSYRIWYAATELDRASTARDLHWATAAALLTEGELSELTSAAPAPGK